jgi:iron-sulfur cluster assembly protein
MLALTPEAVRAVLRFVIAQDASPTAGLRISGGPYSAVDRTWNYSVEHEPLEGDFVIEDGSARVFVDPDAAMELEHAELDAHVDEDVLETRFIVRIRDAS